MAVCSLCDSLDYKKLFQDEVNELSWITEDIAVLYEENSNILEKIKKLNIELENLDEIPKFYEDSEEEDDVEAFAEVVLELLHQEETSSFEKNSWLLREVHLREQLVQQLQTLSQDLSKLQPQHHHLPCHRQDRHLSQHLWGHQSLQWRPPSPALLARARKTKQPGKLLRWIKRRMPMNLMN